MNKSTNLNANQSQLFDPETSIRRALILVAGHFDPDHLPAEERGRAIEMLLEIYRRDADPGVHGAARWALASWHQGRRLLAIDAEPSRERESRDRRWYVNAAGQTMVTIEGPLQFRMGLPKTDPEYQREFPHQRTIPRRFAIAAKEVSIGEFDEFWKEHAASFADPKFRAGEKNLPRGSVTWYMAAAYCNWLSEREGRPAVYYLPGVRLVAAVLGAVSVGLDTQGRYTRGLRVDARAFDLGGYRLPTEAEWEYACRAGTETIRYFGRSWTLLRHYGRLTSWDEASPLPCGSLLPNDFGLFDMLGNLMEWCHDVDYDYKDFENDKSYDFIFRESIDSHCVMQGGLTSAVRRKLIQRTERVTSPTSLTPATASAWPDRCP